MSTTPQLAELVTRYDQSQAISRLLAVAYMKHPGFSNVDVVKGEAIQLAYEHLKTARNVKLFNDVTNLLFEQGQQIVVNPEEVTQRERVVSQELEGLQVKLGQAQNGGRIEEAFELALEVIHVQADRGDMANAMKVAARAKEMARTPKQNADLCLKIISINLFSAVTLPNWSIVQNFTQKLEMYADQLPETELIALRIAQTLVYVERGQYSTAMSYLMAVRRIPVSAKPGAKKMPNQQSASAAKTLDFGPAAAIFFDKSDLTLLTTLLVLATSERSELSTFLNNPDYKVLFESEPEMRQALTTFFDCEYHAALGIIQKQIPRMQVDKFFHGHVRSLIAHIRERALRQYVAPFVALDLNKMATAFHTKVDSLEGEIARLIVNGKIKARIDHANQILRSTHTDPREQAMLKVAELADDFHRESETSLRMLSMQRNGVSVFVPKERGAGGRGERGPGGREGGRRGLGGFGDFLTRGFLR